MRVILEKNGSGLYSNCKKP